MLNRPILTFWVFEVKNSVIISEKVDFVNTKRVSTDLFDNIFDDLIVSSLDVKDSTMVLLTTLTLRRWLPFPPVLGSPTRSLSFWMLF